MLYSSPVYFICLLSGDAEISGRTGQEWEEHVVTEYTFREKAMGDVPDETISCIRGPSGRGAREVVPGV